MKYRRKPDVVDVIQLSDGSADHIEEWDDVAVFLGVSLVTGRGEHATMRRPRLDEPGNVRVTIHTAGFGLEAHAGDYLVRDAGGDFTVCSPDVFAATFEAADVETSGER